MTGKSSTKSSSKAVARVVCLCGATGVGKTSLVTELFPGVAEVIVADSMQVYRGLDIGTAKPGAAERAAVPHHLIDIKDPHETFDVAEFVERAESVIADVHARGRIPIVSGGTAFYFRTLVCGLPATPPADPDVRKHVAEFIARNGAAGAHEELARRDPVSAHRIAVNDVYRTTRALEVSIATGRPLSSFHRPDRPRAEFDWTLVYLDRERSELYRRIDARVGAMFEAGLVDELERLFGSGCRAEFPAMRGIGYREFFDASYFETPPAERAQLVPVIKQTIARNSRRYAKRQRTFFTRLPGIVTVDPDDTDRIVNLVDASRVFASP
ncbi:MAG: tRNA (adenosine(37)-N6)-dimethylallyltransferase MiaA [Spirochaetaceae bacterium]|nr:MAG: tRNA (adenosine(37)-N6)-dimethylallyltransferase MiaA [Spirochaetaceae bacterium]